MNIGIKDVLYRIRPFFILYLLILCACLIIKFLYSRETIYFAVNGLNSPRADALAPYFTDLGDGLFVIALTIIIALFNYRKAFLLITSYAATSLVAQVLLARKVVENWLIWVFVDTIYVGIYIVKGLDATAVMYAIYIPIALLGYIDWRKDWRKQNSLTQATSK